MSLLGRSCPLQRRAYSPTSPSLFYQRSSLMRNWGKTVACPCCWWRCPTGLVGSALCRASSQKWWCGCHCCSSQCRTPSWVSCVLGHWVGINMCQDVWGFELGWCCGRQYWCCWAVSSTACLICRRAYPSWHCIGILFRCTTICVSPPIHPPCISLCGLLRHLWSLGRIFLVPLPGSISGLWDGCTQDCWWFQLGVHTLFQWRGLDSMQKWGYLLCLLGRMPLSWGFVVMSCRLPMYSGEWCCADCIIWCCFCHFGAWGWHAFLFLLVFSSCGYCKTSIMCGTSCDYLLSSWYTK